MPTKQLIQPKTRKRYRFYLTEGEVPTDTVDGVVVYEKPKKILDYDSIKKNNHEAYTKMDFMLNLIYRINQLENSKRDFAEQEVRYQMLVERCVNKGIDPKIPQEDVLQYEATLGEIMKKDISDMISEIPGSIRSEVLNKVKQVIAENEIEYRNSFKFNITRINNLLAINDDLIYSLMKVGSRAISLKDKVSCINGLEKSTKNLIEQLTDVLIQSGEKPNTKNSSPEGNPTSVTIEEEAPSRFGKLVKKPPEKNDDADEG